MIKIVDDDNEQTLRGFLVYVVEDYFEARPIWLKQKDTWTRNIYTALMFETQERAEVYCKKETTKEMKPNVRQHKVFFGPSIRELQYV